jgi:hypothetical protein
MARRLGPGTGTQLGPGPGGPSGSGAVGVMGAVGWNKGVSGTKESVEQRGQEPKSGAKSVPDPYWIPDPLDPGVGGRRGHGGRRVEQRDQVEQRGQGWNKEVSGTKGSGAKKVARNRFLAPFGSSESLPPFSSLPDAMTPLIPPSRVRIDQEEAQRLRTDTSTSEDHREPQADSRTIIIVHSFEKYKYRPLGARERTPRHFE